jgi:hypothetical protein
MILDYFNCFLRDFIPKFLELIDANLVVDLINYNVYYINLNIN